jgi:predicted nucleotidyltransferase
LRLSRRRHYTGGVADHVDVAQVRRFLRDKAAKRRRILDERHARAVADFDRIVALVVEQYPVRRIWQWGSLLDRSRFSEISDIDIALEGVSGPQEFFAIVGVAMEQTSLPVDVIELELVRPEVADRIRKTGRLVYERHGA